MGQSELLTGLGRAMWERGAAPGGAYYADLRGVETRDSFHRALLAGLGLEGPDPREEHILKHLKCVH